MFLYCLILLKLGDQMTKPTKPKLAATVILLRQKAPNLDSQEDCEFEVFMGKRNSNTRFMSNHHVFPGGAIDTQDLTDSSKKRIIGFDHSLNDNLKIVHKYPPVLWVVAIRELFEETGIILARAVEKEPNKLFEKGEKKLLHYQRQLQRKEITMTDILVNENLYYDASNLKYFGRFITPKASSIRFDTQFFLCEYPQNQKINLFKDELTEGVWGTPQQLIKRYNKKEIKIVFPQYSNLKRLSEFRTIPEAFNCSKEVSIRNRALFL
jgi:8-oxo-dGTP pyrophosphatase MutT (NUDIX family)